MKLTNEMRAWLGEQQADKVLLYDLIAGFIKRFGLAPESAGFLISQWIEETL